MAGLGENSGEKRAFRRSGLKPETRPTLGATEHRSMATSEGCAVVIALYFFGKILISCSKGKQY